MEIANIANSLPTNFKLDTGAQANILPYSVFHQLSPRPQLHPASTRLFVYGAEIPLAVEGQCICDVQFEGGRSRKLRFFVLSPTVTAEPLLGLQACDQLNLIKRVSAVESPDLEAVRNDPVAREYIDLFDGVGRMDLYTYKIRLREGAQPFQLCPRNSTKGSLQSVRQGPARNSTDDATRRCKRSSRAN